MALTLVVVDNRNGTATATIDGTGGEVATLYRQAIPVGSWVVAGTRTGDGTLTVTIAPGGYWWYATAGAATALLDENGDPILDENGDPILTEGGMLVSPVVLRVVTDGSLALHSRILDAVVSRIDLMGLDGIVQVRRVDHDAKATLDTPSVIVSTLSQTEQTRGGTNAQDDTGFPAYVVFVDRHQDDQTRKDRLILWRQQVRRAFVSQRLDGVPEVMTCELEPDQVIAIETSIVSYQFSAMTLRFVCREPRGLGA